MTQTLVIDGLKQRRVPINLRQSGNSDARMLISTRVRKSPWWHMSKAAGCRAYTVYNRLYHPRSYVKPGGWRAAGGVQVPHRTRQHVGRGGRTADTGEGT